MDRNQDLFGGHACIKKDLIDLELFTPPALSAVPHSVPDGHGSED